MTVKSNFELDDRIKSIDDIQTILCNNHGFIGCKGFFFDLLVQTKDLTKCHYGTLVDIDINGYSDDHCFKARDENGNDFLGYYRFFLPEKLLKPVKKKYRPFTLAEWIGQHAIGDVIRYRCKSQKIEFRHLYAGYGYGIGTDIKNTTSGTLTLGVASYSFDYLFEDYELFYNGRWLPFGVLDDEKEE